MYVSVLVCKEVNWPTYFDAQCVGHNGVKPITVWVKLLVVPPQQVMLQEIPCSSVVLKQTHVELHRKI